MWNPFKSGFPPKVFSAEQQIKNKIPKPNTSSLRSPLSLHGFQPRSATDCQFGWSPACFAALRGDVQVLKELLAGRVNVNDRIRADEKKFHLEKGMSLLMICAQFCNNAAWSNACCIEVVDGVKIHERVVLGQNAKYVSKHKASKYQPHYETII